MSDASGNSFPNTDDTEPKSHRSPYFQDVRATYVRMSRRRTIALFLYWVFSVILYLVIRPILVQILFRLETSSGFVPPVLGALMRLVNSKDLNVILSNVSATIFIGTLLWYLLMNYLQFGTFFGLPKSIVDYEIPSSTNFSPTTSQYVMKHSISEQAPFAPVTSPASVDGLEVQLLNTTQRLKQEIRELGRRGSVNLVIGILTTFMAVSVLGFIVFFAADVDSSDHWAYTIHFILRISIALFIQIFAYFFLRLYRNNLDEIKYYQNEITNIELKWLALRSVDQTKTSPLLKAVVESLAKTERNFILKKGETTVGLERERLDKNEIFDLVKASLGSIRRTVNRQ